MTYSSVERDAPTLTSTMDRDLHGTFNTCSLPRLLVLRLQRTYGRRSLLCVFQIDYILIVFSYR